MSGLDFFVDLAVTGTVLGLDHTSTREAVHAVFGDEPGGAEDIDSFGLIEFGWHQGRCVYFGAQVHRLSWLDGDLEPVLADRYGTLPDRVDVEELRKAVAARGFPLVEVPYHDDDWLQYWSPVSRIGVLARRSTGSVAKQLGPSNFGLPRNRKQFHDYAKHLLPLSESERERWYAQRAEDTRYWWSRLAAGATGEHTPEWSRLRLAIHRTATARGVHPDGDAALTEVGLLLDVAEPPDDAVRRWLARAEMPAPGDIAAARKLRDEIHQVERAMPHLRDPRLVAALRDWAALKPGLLGG